MRIAVISRSWPSHERSGVTLVAAEHVRLLAEAGHEVMIVGAHPAVLAESLPVRARYHVPARGTGALYAPARVDRVRLAEVLRESAAQLVMVEAWQTALTDAAVDVAHGLGLPVLMISHGVALHPYTHRLRDLVRSWAWAYYRRVSLPKRIRRLTALAVLDMSSPSPRFHDRDLARRRGVPAFPLVNAPVNWRAEVLARSQRKRQIIVVGYYSPVKNQLAALRVMAGLPQDLEFCFVGPRAGRYYERCVRYASKLGLGDRIRFLEDRECDLAEEIGNSLAMLCTSTTEVFPLALLEAMASGTPFVATPVGAVPGFQAGLLTSRCEAQQEALRRLLEDARFWQQQSDAGLREYRNRFTREHVRKGLLEGVAWVAKRADPGDLTEMVSGEFPGGFAVLMAVYQRDDPALFRKALASVFANTLQPSSVWVVVDGPIPSELEAVLQALALQHGGRLRILRQEQNRGLAHALNAGLQRISEPWVVRADADDINLPHRFATLAHLLSQRPELDLMSSAILEVTPSGEPIAVREVPESEAAIHQFVKSRNPFNHMATAYRREKVLQAGGYPAVHLKEDYALWCRMLEGQARVANTREVLVHATAGLDMYRRRGGWKYARAEWEMQRLLAGCGLKPHWRAWWDGCMRAAVFLAPAAIRGMIYRRVLRTRV